LENSSLRPRPQGRKAGRLQNRKKRYQPQHDVEVPFARVVTDISGSGKKKWQYACRLLRTAALGREQDDMPAEKLERKVIHC
jgi:hypothetical protein